MPEEFDLNALDSLLNGNTENTLPEPEPEKDPEPETPAVDDEPSTEIPEPAEPADGGDPDNLESSEKPDQDEGKADQARQNAAFARLRTEHSKSLKVMQELAKALGIEDADPATLGDKLMNMAQEKFAKEQNVPVELYKELTDAKQQLAAVKMHQNQIAAKEKFIALKERFTLEDKELMDFATMLDEEGVNIVTNPDIDVEYEYYKRNAAKLEKKRIQAAVEEALRKSNTADTSSTKPGKQQGKPTEPASKVNNVSALNTLLDGK